MTTYIVSGYMRTGTSMMMDALTAGGLSPCSKVSRNKQLGKRAGGGYHPNPNGFYELESKDYQEQGFPRKFEGQLIKVLFGGLYKMVPGDYKIIFMRRNQEESRQSYEAFFNQPAPKIIANYDATEFGTGNRIGMPLVPTNFEKTMDDCIGIMRQRRDVSIAEIQYRDVIKWPKQTFNEIKEGWEWPIDVDKAAAVIDPKLCRFKIEDLEVGI